jgi:hypothetical protein
VQFLKQNVGYSRIYSIEYTLTSTYAGIAGLQTLGIISAFNVNTFDTFARSFLDSDKRTTVLDAEFLRAWPTGIGNASVDQLRTNMRFYDLLGVRFIIARSNLTRLLSMPLVYNGEVAIYENPHAFPRAFLVHNFTTASGFAEAQEMLAQSNFDLRSEVVIEYPTGELEPLGSAAGYRTYQERVTITNYEPDSVVIEVQTGTAAFLVLTDTYYPGWGVRVDGRPAPIYRADGLFRAVRIEPGRHTVVFTYLPDSFLAGIAISVATAFGLVAYTLRRTPALKRVRISRNRHLKSRVVASGLAVVLP